MKPKDLQKSGRKFFKFVTKTWQLEAHHVQQVIQAAQCLDRIDEAREVIEREGAFFTDRWSQPKPHPGHALEQSNKALFDKLLKSLGLDVEEPRALGRPPRGF